ncbi:hypothetical protein B0H13DRAFT_2299928 [Mycena leptocephala]|nr:hypothetical protein B0H13DRAFT_2299928 [Mycena leptocephala]
MLLGDARLCPEREARARHVLVSVVRQLKHLLRAWSLSLVAALSVCTTWIATPPPWFGAPGALRRGPGSGLEPIGHVQVLGRERRGVVLVLLVVLVPVVRVRCVRFAGGSGEWRALPGAGGVETSLWSAGAGEGCLVGARRLGRQLGSRHGGWVAASVGESVPRPGDEVMGWHLGHFHQLFSPESVSTVWRGVFPTSSSASAGQPVLSHPIGPPILFESPACKRNVEFLPTPCLLREMQSFESGLTAKQADLQSVHHGTRPPSAFCIRDSTSAASFLSGFDAPRYRQTTQRRQRTIRGSPSRTLVEHHSNERSVQRPERQVPVPLLKLSFEDVDLCHLLICPFHWALQQPTSPQDEVVRADLCGAPVLAPHLFHGGRLLPRPQRSLRLLSLECPHTPMVPVSHGERVLAPGQQMWGRRGGVGMDVPPWHEPEHELWAVRHGASVNYIAHQRDGQRRRRGAARSYAAAPTKMAVVANVQGRECQAMVYRAPLVDLAKLTEKEVVRSRDGEFRVCLEGQHWHGVRSQLQDYHSSLAPFKKVLHILRIHNAASPGSSDLPASSLSGVGAHQAPLTAAPSTKHCPTSARTRTNAAKVAGCRRTGCCGPVGTTVPSACSSDELSVRSSWSIDMTSNCRCDCAETSRAREQGERRKRCGDRAVDCAADERSGAALELLNFFFLTDRTYLGAPDAPLPGIDTSSVSRSGIKLAPDDEPRIRRRVL